MPRVSITFLSALCFHLLTGCGSLSSDSAHRPPRIEGRQDAAIPTFAGGDVEAGPLKEDLVRLHRQAAREAAVWLDADQFVRRGNDPDGYWAGMKRDYAARLSATDKEMADVEKRLRRLGVRVRY